MFLKVPNRQRFDSPVTCQIVSDCHALLDSCVVVESRTSTLCGDAVRRSVSVAARPRPMAAPNTTTPQSTHSTTWTTSRARGPRPPYTAAPTAAGARRTAATARWPQSPAHSADTEIAGPEPTESTHTEQDGHSKRAKVHSAS